MESSGVGLLFVPSDIYEVEMIGTDPPSMLMNALGCGLCVCTFGGANE